MDGQHLTGNYRVRALGPAMHEAWRLCRRMRDNVALRRQALKLRYWPENHPLSDAGQIIDLDWSWVRSLPKQSVGELRVHETIAGNDNLRIIFFVGDRKVLDPLPVIWVVRVMQKRRNDFSRNDISIFKARRALVIERFYKPRQ